MPKYSKEMKDRRNAYKEERMIHAIKRISREGYSVRQINDLELQFLYHGEIVRFYPYAGWATGKSITDGRGIQRLIDQISKKNR